MKIDTLHDLYHANLQDAYSACKQALPVTTELGRAASDKELSQALIDGANGISDGMDKLASICADHGIEPTGHHCKGMEGLVTEARHHALEGKFGDNATRDAAIIGQYQRLAHYAIAAYDTLRCFANRLNRDGDGAILTEMLDSGYDGDRRMTEIATSGINREAAD